ncbi:hypothetical protein [uncultured Desulfuromonas sp.]|uniref:hypothetical protein n=1 Tax=uncultured Desulfuromonas sp. TaxID=181013 RepID=UPI002AAC274D|nr:hypothetical protein [uncultured Desulfuromonas sp.]
MRDKEVPQDKGVLDDKKVVSYALNDQGRYCLTPSAGWEPVNCANRLAWEDIQAELKLVRAQIDKGEMSPLAYYMTRAQMDVALLSRYSGIARWRVRRHLKPKVFDNLSTSYRQCYAGLFNISVEQLREVPEQDQLPMADEEQE